MSRTLQQWLLVSAILLILAAAGRAIWQFEQTLKHGQLLVLELAPVDPRSIMQGDFMALAFTLDQQLPKDALQHRYALLQKDSNNIASLHSVSQQRPDNAALVPVLIRQGHRRATLGPNGFFFAEGSAQTYENARYGQFRVDNSGKALLTALLDENLQLLGENKR